MRNSLPDRVAASPKSPYFHPEAGYIAVELDGVILKNCVEAWASQGRVVVRENGSEVMKQGRVVLSWLPRKGKK